MVREPRRYAEAKQADSNMSADERRKRTQNRQRSQTNYTGPRGVLAQPNLAIKTLTGQ